MEASVIWHDLITIWALSINTYNYIISILYFSLQRPNMVEVFISNKNLKFLTFLYKSSIEVSLKRKIWDIGIKSIGIKWYILVRRSKLQWNILKFLFLYRIFCLSKFFYCYLCRKYWYTPFFGRNYWSSCRV